MIPSRHFTLLLGFVLALSTLVAQQPDTSQAPDSILVSPFSWTERLVPLIQNTPLPDHLLLPWDDWGHSDLLATASNPFVPADLKVGAAYLDGSLGHPILSIVIPSAAVGVPAAVTANAVDRRTLATPAVPGSPVFQVKPLQDPDRMSQTYLFLDQGDYLYRDVQIGGAVQIDDTRNLLVAGQSRSHPGAYRRAGPSFTNNENSALQNYTLDYQRSLNPSHYLNYTLLHQREQVGLPFLSESGLRNDRRRNTTWAQGLLLERKSPALFLRLHGASMVSDVRTTTRIELSDALEALHLNRRSLSLWAGCDASYQFSTHFKLMGSWEAKQRNIEDHALGFQSVTGNTLRLSIAWSSGSLILHGGMGMLNGQFIPEGQLAWSTQHLDVQLTTGAASFLDYPHQARRVSLDTTQWLPGPAYLQRSSLNIRAHGRRSWLAGDLAWITTDDKRSAATGTLALEWIPWEEVIRFGGAVTAVSSPDTRLFPTRINALAHATITLPLPRTRARPFVSGSAAYISNEFALWLDPRYADLTPYPEPSGSTRSATAWISGDAGLKVANFELRFTIHNALGNIIRNSPFYLPHPDVGTTSFKHYSLSWRFPPQTK
ncbi:MAG: hypothetical protein JSU61_00665 [Fidelibacterota bacterium]|nr:MAG: hypothetical protein JSU61_00665 [Candidatus Neomarinimicrobiota bacterium]